MLTNKPHFLSYCLFSASRCSLGVIPVNCLNTLLKYLGFSYPAIMLIDLEAPCYGSSTMEKPIYGEHYEGVIQFEKASDWIEENNHIFSTRI